MAAGLPFRHRRYAKKPSNVPKRAERSVIRSVFPIPFKNSFHRLSRRNVFSKLMQTDYQKPAPAPASAFRTAITDPPSYVGSENSTLSARSAV